MRLLLVFAIGVLLPLASYPMEGNASGNWSDKSLNDVYDSANISEGIRSLMSWFRALPPDYFSGLGSEPIEVALVRDNKDAYLFRISKGPWPLPPGFSLLAEETVLPPHKAPPRPSPTNLFYLVMVAFGAVLGYVWGIRQVANKHLAPKAKKKIH